MKKEKRSLFNMVFGNKKQNIVNDNVLRLLSGFNATYTNISDNIDDNIIAKECIHTIATHCAKMMQEILTDIFLSRRYNEYTNDISGISPQSLPAYPNVRRLQPRIFSNYPEKSADRVAERQARA